MITVIINGVAFELTVGDARLLYFNLQEKLYEVDNGNNTTLDHNT